VLETALAYLVLGWLIIQVADIVFDQLHLPGWAGTFVTVFVIAGFPIALVLSWFLEFRDGRAVLHELSPADARRRRFSRTYLSVVGALTVAAVIVFAYDRFLGLPVAGPGPVAPAEQEITVADNSIAVLPFLNNDGSEETQVFANGLVDDVITRLSRVPGLLVASRGDASTLEPNTVSERVRQRLRVAMYVEGSVEMHGDEIRVIVQLIDSATGFHILSRTFDRPKRDFFAIRDEITQLTVSSLRVTLPESSKGRVASSEPVLDAYLLYRRGADELDKPRTIDALAMALGWFDAALDVDPEYAAAHAGRCRTFAWMLTETGDSKYAPQAEAACNLALELNPNLDIVHAALGRMYVETGKHDAAESAFREALRINEHNVEAMIGLSKVYLRQNRPEDAEAVLLAAIGAQPGDWDTYSNLGVLLYRQGRYEEAAEQFAEVVSIDPGNVRGLANLGSSYMMAGDFALALNTYKHAIDVNADRLSYVNLGMANYYLGRYEDAEAALGKAIEIAPERHLSWSNLGDVLFVAGKKERSYDAYLRAEELLEERIGVNPGDPGSQMDHAWVHAMLGEKEISISEISKARASAPDDPYASYIEGLIYHHFGDNDAALDALERAVASGYSTTILSTEPLLSDLRAEPRFVRITGAADEGREQ
jgi:tetratricopeptide (TPR) repeat protein